jgi:hypothetical protein
MCLVLLAAFVVRLSLWRPQTLGAVELEQLQSVGATDLQAIHLRDRAGVEPSSGMVDVLERPVGREQDVTRHTA